MINQNECWCERRKLDDRSLSKDGYVWNPSTSDCDCNASCKTDQYLVIKSCSYEKGLIGKLVLACEDEILNTVETSQDEKKLHLEKYLAYSHGCIE